MRTIWVHLLLSMKTAEHCLPERGDKIKAPKRGGAPFASRPRMDF